MLISSTMYRIRLPRHPSIRVPPTTICVKAVLPYQLRSLHQAIFSMVAGLKPSRVQSYYWHLRCCLWWRDEFHIHLHGRLGLSRVRFSPNRAAPCACYSLEYTISSSILTYRPSACLGTLQLDMTLLEAVRHENKKILKSINRDLALRMRKEGWSAVESLFQLISVPQLCGPALTRNPASLVVNYCHFLKVIL